MSEFEVIRLIGEVIGIVTLIGGGIWYLARQVWRVLEEVASLTKVTTELKDHQKAMNGHVQDHSIMDDARFQGISNRLSHIEGKLGLPLAGVEEPQ